MVDAEEILKEPPIKLLYAAFASSARGSAEEAICRAAVKMVLALPASASIQCLSNKTTQ